MDSEKQPEGFEGVGGGRLGEPGGGYQGGHGLHGAWVWCKNDEYGYTENLKINKLNK